MLLAGRLYNNFTLTLNIPAKIIMERPKPLLLCALFLTMQVYDAFAQNSSQKLVIQSMNPYDTIITVVVNDTTEQLMNFYETAADRYRFPTRVHVSTNDTITEEYPVFITATQQRGISSWELPLVIQTRTATLRFNDMGRTLCPHDAGNKTQRMTRPTLRLTTLSPTNVSLSLKLRRVVDFDVATGNESTVQVMPSTPHYYHFSFRDPPRPVNRTHKDVSLLRFNYTIPKSVILIIDSDDDICAVVSIQNNSCPVFDNEQDVVYDGYHLTMTRKGGITLTDSMFPQGFFIVFIVKESDEACTGVSEMATATGVTLDQGQVQVRSNNGRVKNLRFRIIATISYKEYAIAAAVTLAVLAVIAMFALFVYIPACACNKAVTLPVDVPRLEREISMAGDTLVAGEGDLSSDSEPDPLGISAPDMTVHGLSRAKPAAHLRRSNRYFWSALTVAVVYALPVVQLLSTYQRMVLQTGDQDLCYYNFLCANPLGALSDFNHVYSNIGYVALGLVFMAQTRARQLSSKRSQLGIPHHHGLLYSLGLALIMEGVLSACYHLCPNKMNFQFDSSFMYVIAVICMVKLYQNRHPDVNASAHSTFMLLAVIMAIGLLGIMFPSVWFRSLFTAAHLSVCLVITMKVYYVGRFQFSPRALRRAQMALRSRGWGALRPEYRARAVLLAIANAANLALAVYGLVEYKSDFAKHLLAILMGNTIIYMFYYIIMKMVHREKVYVYSWLYLALATAAWLGALALFLDSRTKWSQTPANSRRHNAVCSALGFYDSHDLWHVVSAAALYLTFNLVLTIDDGLVNVNRRDIPVF